MGMRFVFKLKRFADGTIERYKARLVARGFMQIHGVHYVDSFSPTANIVSLRLALVLGVNIKHMFLRHMDVKAAFLNSVPKFANYIMLPEGMLFRKSKYALMLKNIYGTKDAARGWYEDQHIFLIEMYHYCSLCNGSVCIYFIVRNSICYYYCEC